MSLLQLIEKVVAPYQSPEGQRISLAGSDIPVAQSHTTKIALLVHELATNAAKYGALSVSEGKLTIKVHLIDGVVRIEWRETEGPEVLVNGGTSFGTRLIDSTVASFPATIKREWKPEGLTIELEVGADILRPASS